LWVATCTAGVGRPFFFSAVSPPRPSRSHDHGGTTFECIPIAHVRRTNEPRPRALTMTDRGPINAAEVLTPSTRCCMLIRSFRVLTAIKERLAAAKTGHDLLKRKSDAIKVNLNNILKKILVVRRGRHASYTNSELSSSQSRGWHR
jgi:hypothetical protein